MPAPQIQIAEQLKKLKIKTKKKSYYEGTQVVE
jgi:hypothetical protein